MDASRYRSYDLASNIFNVFHRASRRRRGGKKYSCARCTGKRGSFALIIPSAGSWYTFREREPSLDFLSTVRRLDLLDDDVTEHGIERTGNWRGSIVKDKVVTWRDVFLQGIWRIVMDL